MSDSLDTNPDTNVVARISNTARTRVGAYIEMLRISNLPSVFSNVLVGAALGAGNGHIPIESALPCAVAIAFLYLGGMALNDAVDVEADRVERPERPIPSGRLSVGQAYRLAAFTFCLGLVVLASISQVAVGMGMVLVGIIAAYDFLHKRFAPSVLLMGAARGMVYLTAAVAVAGTLVVGKPLWFVVTLTAYTTAFTIVARSENRNDMDSGRWVAAGIPLIVLVPGVWMTASAAVIAGVVGILVVVWQARAVVKVFRIPPETKQAVHIWLSGFCLIDVFYLSFVGNLVLAGVALVCFVLTLLLQRRFMGT
ncbi:MAG: UbiA family prenyltransferase [Acidobacteria bacterium]|nr:UbiA family prenyltransferase [Acidobacteriota bacterium]